jgi:phenylacetic acid degradation operon negative regulatory protein
VSGGQSREVVTLAAEWGEQTSARSVLVTVFGDSIAPLGGEIWLADVFGLVEPFGFTQRLVRTSMFRLVSEGWLDNERIGRRSRYRLTPFAALEFADADRRIYRRRSPAWDEQWSLVLTDTELTTGDDRERLVNHLRWHGFVEIAPGVWALPEPKPDAANELLDRLGLASRPPVAQANFARLGELVDEGLFRASFDLEETEAVYREFVTRFAPLADADLAALAPLDAFAVRTMVVHDLRRARLVDPELPTVLLPEGWVGGRAFDLAGELYRAVTDRAWEAVEAMTDLRLADADGRVAARFTEG